MTNVELSASMQELARIYALQENTALSAPFLQIPVNSKDELLGTLRAIGGMFVKKPSDYYMNFESQRLPGVTVYIPRDKVCRKVVTWECEPLLSVADMVEVDDAAQTPRAGKVLAFPEREKLAA